jgi:hypothetical protein
MIFAKYNNNPIKKKGIDCSVRAVATGTEQSWDQVYQDLCGIGFTLKDMPNSKEVIEKYLSIKGFTRMKMPKKEDGTKYMVHELVDKMRMKTRKVYMVIQVANHFTASIDDELIDTWNCGDKSVYNYYIKN